MSKYKNIIDKKYTELTNKINEKISKKDYDINIIDKSLYTLKIVRDDKKILECKYEIIGYYDNKTNFFMWNHGAPCQDKNNEKNSLIIKNNPKKIKNIAIENEYIDKEYIEFLLYCVSNNIFMVENNYIDPLLEYICCITNTLGYVISKNNNYETIYLITDILQM